MIALHCFRFVKSTDATKLPQQEPRKRRARQLRCLPLLAMIVMTMGASHRTRNFIVTSSTEAVAKQIALTAEGFRNELAVEWLGHHLPNWSQPCPITAAVDPGLGAGGATSYLFEQGEVFGWRMTMQGSLERVLDSVLPHEVTHMILATHFRRKLPRWADEGACTTVEHFSERSKQHELLERFLKSQRGIAFNRMFALKEYPHDVLPLYSQGYSVVRFLIAQGGRKRFLEYLSAGDSIRDQASHGRATRMIGAQHLSQKHTQRDKPNPAFNERIEGHVEKERSVVQSFKAKRRVILAAAWVTLLLFCGLAKVKSLELPPVVRICFMVAAGVAGALLFLNYLGGEVWRNLAQGSQVTCGKCGTRVPVRAFRPMMGNCPKCHAELFGLDRDL